MLLPMSRHCSFCSLPAERILFDTALAVIIRDAYPVSEGHTLILPKRHVGSWFEANVHEQQAMLELLARAKKELDKELKPAGYNIGINDGVAAGQTEMHLHLHLIPRYKGDREDPRGGIRWVIPDKAPYWQD